MTLTKNGQFLATMMTPPRRAVLACLALTAALGSIASAQTPPATILTIEMENVIQYQESFANPQKNGTSTAMEVSSPPATFFPGTFIADIVAINGRKSKGATVGRNYWVGLNTNPSGSQAIADVTRFQAMEISLEIQQADGTSVGTIVLTGVTAGPPALGAAKSGTMGAFAVIGGTGAFLGARGHAATIMINPRITSTLENPINRRTFPAGLWKLAVQLLPMRTPEVTLTASGPAIVHSSDYSVVTARKPAHAGEVLPCSLLVLAPRARALNQAKYSLPAQPRL